MDKHVHMHITCLLCNSVHIQLILYSPAWFGSIIYNVLIFQNIDRDVFYKKHVQIQITCPWYKTVADM